MLLPLFRRWSLRQRKHLRRRFTTSNKKINTSVLVVATEPEGLALALFLKRFGANPTVIWPTRFDNEGKGILLPPTANRALSFVNSGLSVVSDGVSLAQYTRFGEDGTELSATNLRVYERKLMYSYVGIDKLKLLENLSYLLKSPAFNIKINFGENLQSMDHVKLEDGTVKLRCVLENGSSTRTLDFDYVAGADGPFSKVRQLAWASQDIEEHGKLRCFFGTIKKTSATGTNTVQEFWGKKKAKVLTFFPVSSSQVAFWGHVALPQDFKPPRDEQEQRVRTAEFLDNFSEFKGLFSILRNQLEALPYINEMYHYDYCITDELSPVRAKVALIGRAAWGIPPLIHGHDTAVGFEDALSLAVHLVDPKHLGISTLQYANDRQKLARATRMYARNAFATAKRDQSLFQLLLNKLRPSALESNSHIDIIEWKLTGYPPGTYLPFIPQ